ncbi:lysine transporter LysE [Chitinimonas prasina]|uniref:Lysine transporter LysE n=1 Tax=Chitinimonas prasina TaxID=1434937 RepID=A0ABQ5YH27_9NEIS|nr:LysE family translocator [Chitinimonas prasina]GLR13753.1 lysine transporter LysE [Chitinimonas prasina]
MFGTHDLWLFILSGLMLNIAPGPDSLYIASRAAGQGFRAGSAAALGIGLGTFVHIFAAALGLSAILATSATAFTVVKLIGAAYLIWVGISMLRSKATTPGELSKLQAAPLSTIFWQGFWTNVLNPKVALFFLAFVPQFIDAAAPSKALAFIFLGAIFNFNGMLWCHTLAYTAAKVSSLIQPGTGITQWLNRSMGVLFLFLGIKLAFSRQT